METRDRYGRLLGYVYDKDGRMINELLLKSGHARPMRIAPNVGYSERFSEIYKPNETGVIKREDQDEKSS